MSARSQLGTALVLLLLLGLLAWQQHARSMAGAAGQATPIVASAPSREPALTALPRQRSSADRLVMSAKPAPEPVLPAPSLQGSQADGGLAVDATGQLVVDAALRRFFDWHRSATGELSESEIRAWLRASIEAQLIADSSASTEALRMYDLYLDYLRSLDAIAAEVDPWQRQQQTLALRERLFGRQRAQALFSDEDLWSEAQLARQAIKQDPGLSAAERARQLQALEASLPAEFRPDAMTRLAAEADALSRAYDQNQIPEAQRFRERSELLGVEAAQRFAALDAQRQDWEQRMQLYRQRWLQARSNSESSRDFARWAAQNFTAAELRRIEALLEAGG